MMKKCIRCNNDYNGRPALSRRDNKTDICSACGSEEAIIDATLVEQLSLSTLVKEAKFIENIGKDYNEWLKLKQELENDRNN